MTELETKINNTIVSLWNMWLELPIQHTDDTEDFRRCIHTLQDITGRRILRDQGHYQSTSELPSRSIPKMKLPLPKFVQSYKEHSITKPSLIGWAYKSENPLRWARAQMLYSMFSDMTQNWKDLPVSIQDSIASKYGFKSALNDKVIPPENCEPDCIVGVLMDRYSSPEHTLQLAKDLRAFVPFYMSSNGEILTKS